MNARMIMLTALIATALGLGGIVRAQTTQPSASTMPSTASSDAGGTFEDTLKNFDESMTREEIEALVKKANENRLKTERQLVASEIRNELYDQLAQDDALALLAKGAKNTQQDNIDRICQAYAKVDSKFGKFYKLYTQKKFKEAVAAGKPLVGTQSTYLNAARGYVYALALEGAGMNDDAADAYASVMQDMYDRISFASESSLRAAQLYERIGRGMYAMQMYAYSLKNYGLTLPQDQFDRIFDKVKQLQEVYGDPMGTVAKMMSDVKERLAKTDSGALTQDKEKQIVAILNDLIKTAEEKEQSSSSSSNPKKGPPKPGKKPGEGEGEESKPGTTPGGMPKKPSSPAPFSVLRLGDTARGSKGEVHDTKEGGEDWSKLPAAEKEKLQELQKQRLNERYRDIISDYHKSMSK